MSADSVLPWGDGPNPDHLARLDRGVSGWNAWREQRARASLRAFSTCDFPGASLAGRDLAGVDFSDGSFVRADFRGANLRSANFRGADLTDADLTEADLSGADFRDGTLSGCAFSRARLDGARFEGARVYRVVFARNDLRTAEGLDRVLHQGPSSIGIDTVIASRGKIPSVFLRGCGVPESMLGHVRSLGSEPFEFDRCFISYSTPDQGFVRKLYADLQAKGVVCWLAENDLPIGGRIRDEIEQAIQVNDKVLLVLSANSLHSAWVETEVETALDKEAKQKRSVLFPVRIDDSVLEEPPAWGKHLRQKVNIGDFTRWSIASEYERALERLVRDLGILSRR